MKWTALALIVALILPTASANAAPPQQNGSPPTNFTIALLSETHVFISWTQNSDANQTQLLKMRPDGVLEQVGYSRQSGPGEQSWDYYEHEAGSAYYLIELK